MVAGMLLVDSSHEQQARRFGSVDWRKGPVFCITVAARRQSRILGMCRLAAAFGLVRGLDAEIAREAPPEYAGAYRAILLSSRRRRVSVRQILMAAHTWGQPPELDSIPLTVLTPASSPGWDWPAWRRCKMSWPRCRLIASTSGHRKPGTTSSLMSRTWLSRRSVISSGAAGQLRDSALRLPLDLLEAAAEAEGDVLERLREVEKLQEQLAAAMDAAQSALDAVCAMPVKDECDGCHGIKEAAIQDALRRIGLCETTEEILDPLAGRLRTVLERLRQVPQDLGEVYELVYQFIRKGGKLPAYARWVEGEGSHA
jgi:hypothetical protein